MCHEASLKTIKKWENELACSFEYEFDKSNVTDLHVSLGKVN